MTKGQLTTKMGLLCAGLIAAGSSHALTFNYTDFSDLSDWQLNNATAAINPGGASGGVTGPNPGDGQVLRMTNANGQSGSAFISNQISLQNQASFSAQFDFQFTDQGGITQAEGNGADGIVFTIQNVSNTSGGSGGGIGYTGLSNSLGIEFDNWNNGPGLGDPNANHVAINTNGVFSPVGPLVGDLGSLGIDLDSGAILSSWIDYNGATDLLEVRVATSGSARPISAFLSTVLDLETVLGSSSAFVGFTSGTGAANADHDIRSLVFENDFNPGGAGNNPPTPGVPLPAPLLLLGAGMLGLAARARRN